MDILTTVKRALKEDIGTGDVSAALLPEKSVKAQLLTRESMVLAGLPWVEAAFHLIDKDIICNWQVKEGEYVATPRLLGTISGEVRAILTVERTALNFLQTLSATATTTKKYVDAIAGTKAKIRDTRKTLPGLRLEQKYAVRCGGGYNHRMGLYDAYLVKENHIQALGSITKAVERARALNKDLSLEVEVTNLMELQEAMKAQPDCILLDNFSLSAIKDAVSLHPACPLEVSGGVTLHNVRAIAETGVDWIAIGGLTKSIEAIDLTLLVE